MTSHLLDMSPDLASRILYHFGLVFCDLRDDTSLEQLLKIVRDETTPIYEDEKLPYALHFRGFWGVLYSRRGLPEEYRLSCIEIDRKMLEVVGPNHFHRTEIQMNLATAYCEAAQPKKAIPILTKLLKIYKSDELESNLNLLIARFELACAYRASKMKKITAIQDLERIVEDIQYNFPEIIIQSSDVQYELASAYMENGQTQKAIDLLERLIIKLRSLPENSYDPIHSQHVLACAYLQAGDCKKAVSQLEGIISLTIEGNRDLAVASDLGLAYGCDGSFVKGIDRVEGVLRGQKALGMVNDPGQRDTQRLLSNLQVAQRGKSNL